MNDWTSVSHDLPNNWDNVLAYRESDGWMVVCTFTDGLWYFNPDEAALAISHWMYLPDAPSQE